MAANLTLSNLTPKEGARKRHKRLGCGDGSGHGKTSTRGHKGQRARSGDGKLVGFEGGQNPLFRRLPKRGFRNTSFRREYQVVDLKDISRVFKNQNEVNLEALRMHGFVRGRSPVKVLGDGEITRAMKIQAHAFSKSTQEKIRKVGGSPEILSYS